MLEDVDFAVKYLNANIEATLDGTTQNWIHQVDPTTIRTVLEIFNFSLTRNCVINMLKKDGAYFYHDSLRYYNPETKTFLLLTPTSDLDKIAMENHEILIWMKGTNYKYGHKLKRKVQKLKQRVIRLENAMEASKLSTGSMRLPSLTTKLSTEDPLTDANSSDLRPPPLLTDRGFSSIHWDQGSSLLPSRKLDLAIMYAEPLVRREGKNKISLPDAVDYDKECSKIVQALEAKNMRIEMVTEIATRQTFINVLSKAPTILHILCHGEFDRNKQQFYLCFENVDGELDPVYESEFKDILSKRKTLIKIVFVNACHSEPVARIFQEAGVNCVIAVQSEVQIADFAAQIFAQAFYNNIFDGLSIGEAFQNARDSSKSCMSASCCCAHSHKPDCKWHKRALVEGYYKAHVEHNPTCTNCPKKNEHTHSMQCSWAKNFVSKYGPDDTDLLYDYFYDLSNNQIYTCCCSPELPHDEALKFLKIPAKSEEVDNMVLFSNPEPGKVIQRSKYDILEQIFPVNKLIGRNMVLYDLFRALNTRNPQKYVALVGSPGGGKSVLVKQLANYLHARGFFRHKIAIIEMEKIESVAHFLSELCRETDSAYDRSMAYFLSELYQESNFAFDFTAFCEAIKYKEILFILENCDKILSRNKTDFATALKEVATHTKSVKFLIVANKEPNLGLTETLIVLKNLEPVNAAKFLLQITPLEKLPPQLRTVEDLKNSQLFTKLGSIPPQTIWWISQRLIGGEQFSKIEQEMVQKKICESSAEELIEQSIYQSFNEIKNQKPQCYNLLYFICLFPSGLSSIDLEILAKCKIIDENWAELMSEIVMQKTQGKGSPKSSLKQEKPPSKELDAKPRIAPGNYFALNITEDSTRENVLFFSPSESALMYTKKIATDDQLDMLLAKMTYLGLLCLSMIEQAKVENLYNEHLVEYSMICDHGIWLKRKDNSLVQDWYKLRENFGFQNKEKSAEGPSTELYKIFQMHESNFLSVLDVEQMKMLLEKKDVAQKTKDTIEVFWLAIPTVFKVFAARASSCISVCSTVLGRIGDLDLPEDNFVMLKIKLHFFLFGVYASHKKDAQAIYAELIALEKLKGNLEDDKIRLHISVEIAFAKAYFFYKLKKGKYSKSDQIIVGENEKRYRNVINLIRENCDTVLAKMDDSFEVERGRVAILVCKILVNIEGGIAEDTFKQRVRSAIEIFGKYGCKRLELQANFLMVRLQQKQFTERGKEATAQQIREEADLLDAAKRTYLQTNALNIVKYLNDSQYEAKVKRFINDINSSIRQTFMNVVALLKAAPLTAKNDSDRPRTMIPAFFKSDLINILNETNRVLHLKFELLTRTMLTETMDSGCRLLYLDSTMTSPNGLVAESTAGEVEVIPYEDLKSIFCRQTLEGTPSSKPKANCPSSRCLELVILGTKNDEAMVEFLTKELKIPNVVCFRFKDKEKDYLHRLFEETFKEAFVDSFLFELVSGRPVKKAFELAVRNAKDCLSTSFFESAEDRDIEEIIGEGAVLIPLIEEIDYIHQEAFFESEEYKLPQGRIEDISTSRGPTNLSKIFLPFVERQTEMLEIVKALGNIDGSFLKITGESGCGRTRLVLETAYYLLTMNEYPDGIFYFPLQKVGKMNLFEMLKTALNSEIFGSTLEKNIKNMFRNKKMLVMFDDFDTLYSRIDTFPRLIFLILKKCKISTIVVTKSKPNQSDSHSAARKMSAGNEELEEMQQKLDKEFVGKTINIKPLSDAEIKEMVIAYTDKKAPLIKAITESPTPDFVTDCKGNLQKLVKNLQDGKYQVQNEVLTIIPHYVPYLDLNKIYLDKFRQGKSISTVNRDQPSLGFSRHSVLYNLTLKRKGNSRKLGQSMTEQTIPGSPRKKRGPTANPNLNFMRFEQIIPVPESQIVFLNQYIENQNEVKVSSPLKKIWDVDSNDGDSQAKQVPQYFYFINNVEPESAVKPRKRYQETAQGEDVYCYRVPATPAIMQRRRPEGDILLASPTIRMQSRQKKLISESPALPRANVFYGQSQPQKKKPEFELKLKPIPSEESTREVPELKLNLSGLQMRRIERN